VIINAKIPSTKLDIRTARTTVGSISFNLLDKNEIISAKTMGNDSNWLDTEVTVYVGFITGSFDWADYLKLTTNTITSYNKRENQYSFKAETPSSLIVDQVFQTIGNLDGDINPVQNTVDLVDATAFPSSGRIKINNEYMQYTGKSTNQLTGVVRGDEFSEADDHGDGDDVLLIFEVTANPIDLMLQILTSDAGDLSNGIYDVLQNGLGIDQALVDVAQFESIRDTSLSGDTYRFLLEPLDNALNFIQDEILLPTRTRLVDRNGKISLTELDVLNFGLDLEEVDESSIIANPSWQISSKKIINEIRVKWNFDYGSQRFTRVSTFTNDDSITRYGKKKTITYEFKGINAANGGTLIVTDLATRLLNRLSTATPQIKANVFFKNSKFEVGDDIRLSHRYLPQQGGSLGFSDQLEILSRSIDFNTKRVTLDLEFTSFAGIRIGLIAPSPTISNVIDQKTFDVPDGSCYKAGYVVRIWSDSLNTYLPDPINVIDNINNNTITMVNDFDTPLVAGLRLKFSTYDDADADQRARYAYTVGNTNVFSIDGSKGYQILF
jgi:hypothetical protein